MTTVSNNRISVVLDEQTMAQIKGAFQTINELMPFLIGLSADEIMGMPKISVSNKQFVHDALNAMKNNPSLFPTYLSSVELNKDITLYTQLDDFVIQSQQLMQNLRDTQTLAGSEAYVAALSVYRQLEAASIAGVPGAEILYQQLAERFKHTNTTNAINKDSSAA